MLAIAYRGAAPTSQSRRFDGVAVDAQVILGERQCFALGDTNLFSYQIVADDFFRNRMFHLQAGIGFHEVKPAGLRFQQKFNSAKPAVVHGFA